MDVTLMCMTTFVVVWVVWLFGILVKEIKRCLQRLL
jgi:hypothetical protein